ncbi:uncharacterized protein LOC123465798 isoform X2 [Bubalus bubalis]|uniref:uncharacterized protein LOC123465798 isoform X2 n=1 Tax=Bubalus bubalis TaxID=89462 RepID=UPI001E1B8AAC|nr:uncharacterized protein LOC123465798 isoform X2 [Bubalus bubalis]
MGTQDQVEPQTQGPNSLLDAGTYKILRASEPQPGQPRMASANMPHGREAARARCTCDLTKGVNPQEHCLKSCLQEETYCSSPPHGQLGQRKASLTGGGGLASPLLTVLLHRVRAWLCFSELPDQLLFVLLVVFLQVPPQKIFLRDLTQRLGQAPSYHSDRVRPICLFLDLLQL